MIQAQVSHFPQLLLSQVSGIKSHSLTVVNMDKTTLLDGSTGSQLSGVVVGGIDGSKIFGFKKNNSLDKSPFCLQ